MCRHILYYLFVLLNVLDIFWLKEFLYWHFLLTKSCVKYLFLLFDFFVISPNAH